MFRRGDVDEGRDSNPPPRGDPRPRDTRGVRGQGPGSTVGSVFASEKYVAPMAVGVDIGCGAGPALGREDKGTPCHYPGRSAHAEAVTDTVYTPLQPCQQSAFVFVFEKSVI